jgi:hypothetical protein
MVSGKSRERKEKIAKPQEVYARTPFNRADFFVLLH